MLVALTSVRKHHHHATGFDQVKDREPAGHSKLIERLPTVTEPTSRRNRSVTNKSVPSKTWSDQAPRGVSKRTCLEVGWPSSNRRLRTFAKRPRHVVPTRGSRPADPTLSQVAEKPCSRMHGPNRLEPTKLQTYPMDDPTKPHAFRRLVAQNRRPTLDLRAYASLSKSPPMSGHRDPTSSTFSRTQCRSDRHG